MGFGSGGFRVILPFEFSAQYRRSPPVIHDQGRLSQPAQKDSALVAEVDLKSAESRANSRENSPIMRVADFREQVQAELFNRF